MQGFTESLQPVLHTLIIIPLKYGLLLNKQSQIKSTSSAPQPAKPNDSDFWKGQ